MDNQEKIARIENIPFWFHSIDLGNGIITPGQKSHDQLLTEYSTMKVPPLDGKSVLDVGAWDGFFSFQAEREGAGRVMALDHYIWSMNIHKQQAYYRNCRDKGVVPSPYHMVPGHWDPGNLPGKRGFDTAHRILNSRVEQIVADFMTMDLVTIGAFDVAFFLGVLYHLENPFEALKRLAMLTRETAIIETAAIYIPGREENALFEFYESNELAADVGNWWAPNLMGLKKMCQAAGFRDVIAVGGPDVSEEVADSRDIIPCRITVQAWH
jgi:tRNA (mo5U34)-methyltransferase